MNSFRDDIDPSWTRSFDVYEGAEHNLPDQAAMDTAQRIEKMISNTMSADDILLVLISGKIPYRKKETSYYSCTRKFLSAKHWTWIFGVFIKTLLKMFIVV